MGDRELNKAPKVTDMAYVPVVMADGSIGQIAKADLASVVAEQMGNPIAYKRVLSGDENFDNIKESGIYMVGNITEGAISSPGSYGTLLVFGTGYYVQYFFSYGNQTLVRVWNGTSVWNEWKRIA